MDPISASKDIESVLCDYIRRALPVERADPSMTPLLDELFKEHRLLLPQYLEMLPDYKRGPSLQELVDEDTIQQETADIFAAALAGDKGAARSFRLYEHQAYAIRAVAKHDKNLIVCSGTGSGKTECFLIPLIEHLVRMRESGQLATAGVQAMILYPTNALVNDQIRRLRRILQYCPEIRFGKFTGELEALGDEETVSEPDAGVLEALSDLFSVRWSGAGFDDEAALLNEVTSRREWFKTPAHILVTNYSMLERLLLQPQSTKLFNTAWKFIILDEAHCYDGGLGTEIAWLLRRLKKRLGNPGALRFMATSATLIDDPALSEEEKTQRIQSEFASQLFPASADSFSVQFGHRQHFTPPPESYQWQEPCAPHTYAAISDARLTASEQEQLRDCVSGNKALMDGNEVSVLQLTQQLLGAERWLGGMERVEDLVNAGIEAIAIGDAAYLVQQLHAGVTTGLVAIPNRSLLEKGFIAEQSVDAIQKLLKFLESTVAEFSDRDDWRDWLHDHADPSGSSDPTDMVRPDWLPNDHPGFRNAKGNRLYVLREWTQILIQGDVSQLSDVGLEYLVRSAVKAAVLLETQVDNDIPVVRDIAVCFSPQAAEQIRSCVASLRETRGALTKTRAMLTNTWRRLATEVTDAEPPQGMRLESVASWILGADPRVNDIARHLETSVATDARNEDARLDLVVKAIFPEIDNADAASQSLTRLINLCSLAVPRSPAGNKRPLLDLRYHQLARGLAEVGIVLKPSGGDAAQPVKLLRSDDDVTVFDGASCAVFTLGACRDCGQPFALGYAKQSEIAVGAGLVSLSRVPTEQAPYLHAFAWRLGNRPADAEEIQATANPPSIWLNLETGQAASGPRPQGENWVAIEAYRHGPPERPAFIADCPCCGEQQQAQKGTRFGLITPYEAGADQFRLVLLDQLYRKLEPSSEPRSRRHEGAGRKLLAFSDSRKAAARLALGYQEWAAETLLGRLIPLAVRHFSELTLANIPSEVRASFLGGLEADYAKDNARVPEHIAADKLNRVLASPNVSYISEVLLYLLQHRYNAGRLLELSSSTGVDLSPSEAAQVRLLQGLRSKSRYSVTNSGRIKIVSRAITDLRALEADDVRQYPYARLKEKIPDPIALASLCGEIYAYLVGVARIRIPDNWPSEFINSRWTRLVKRDSSKDALRFVSHASNSALNSIVRGKCNLPNSNDGRAKAEQYLDWLWQLLTLGNAPVLVLVENGSYMLRYEDILLSEGAARDQNRPVQPQERFDSYLDTREVISARIEEHTAQIGNDLGAAYQRAFSDGRISMLSCSTTFEMGVDLGDLNCVFLANLAPGVANYRQRAGRAGRRPGAAAYVVCFVADTPHDRYYSQYPTRLIFGHVETPRIYLNNKLFRARHLRAEALHDFLRTVPQITSATNPLKNHEQREQRLNWDRTGDFFAGRMYGYAKVGGNRHYGISSVFEPIVNHLRHWRETRAETVQASIASIDDVNVPATVEYLVADDLVWQIGCNADLTAFAPFPLIFCSRRCFRELAGPNQPEPESVDTADEQSTLFLKPDVLKREVFERFCQSYREQGADRFAWDGGQAGRVSGGQKHMLQESTITWLTRNRVLPKYGFPVDVIQLIPAETDRFGESVELERDLTQGLYEYAPGQKVIANKRVFESAGTVCFTPGGVNAALENAETIWLCGGCREIKKDEPPENFCDSCNELFTPWTVVKPDAFRASRSRAGSVGLVPPPGVPRQVYHGGVEHVSQVPDLRLRTAESRNGELWYFNFGSGYAGFNGPHGKYGLWHPVKTDIAIWLPSAEIFLQQPVCQWEEVRRKYAMESAMQAILRSAAIRLQVSDRDIGGLLYPDRAHLGDGLGFVIFDTSSGGGGAVLPLVLGSGSDEEDRRRAREIAIILHNARDLCRTCKHCNKVHPDADLGRAPVTATEYRVLTPEQRGDVRLAQSCYDCLRSFQNQRSHDHLDRHDAIAVLTALLSANTAAVTLPINQSAQRLSVGFDLPPQAGTIFHGPALRGLPSASDRTYTYRRLSDTEAIPVRSLCVVRRDHEYVVARLQPGLTGGWIGYAAAADADFTAITLEDQDRDDIVALVIG